MKNEELIKDLEEQIRQRDDLNNKILEEFEAAYKAARDSENLVRKYLPYNLYREWSLCTGNLRSIIVDNKPYAFEEGINALKSLMNLIEYSEFLEAKMKQD